MFFLFLDPTQLARHQAAQFPHLGRALEFVDVVRAVDSTMSVGALAAFLHVAKRIPDLAGGETSLRDIADEMGVAPTSLARQIDLLAEGATTAVRGLNLLEKGVHPADKRQRQVRLTPDGMRLLSKLSAVMGGAQDPNKSGARSRKR
jgi:DNA-binding MarR family transcriptional regulator